MNATNAVKRTHDKSKPVNYTAEQLDGYVEFCRTGRATQLKYFDTPVSEVNFTEDDWVKVREARKAHKALYANVKAKSMLLKELRSKTKVVTANRINFYGDRQVVRIKDTSVKRPEKVKLTLVPAPRKPKSTKPAPAPAAAEVAAPAATATEATAPVSA